MYRLFVFFLFVLCKTSTPVAACGCCFPWNAVAPTTELAEKFKAPCTLTLKEILRFHMPNWFAKRWKTLTVGERERYCVPLPIISDIEESPQKLSTTSERPAMIGVFCVPRSQRTLDFSAHFIVDVDGYCMVKTPLTDKIILSAEGPGHHSRNFVYFSKGDANPSDDCLLISSANNGKEKDSRQNSSSLDALPDKIVSNIQTSKPTPNFTPVTKRSMGTEIYEKEALAEDPRDKDRPAHVPYVIWIALQTNIVNNMPLFSSVQTAAASELMYLLLQFFDLPLQNCVTPGDLVNKWEVKNYNLLNLASLKKNLKLEYGLGPDSWPYDHNHVSGPISPSTDSEESFFPISPSPCHPTNQNTDRSSSQNQSLLRVIHKKLSFDLSPNKNNRSYNSLCLTVEKKTSEPRHS